MAGAKTAAVVFSSRASRDASGRRFGAQPVPGLDQLESGGEIFPSAEAVAPSPAQLPASLRFRYWTWPDASDVTSPRFTGHVPITRASCCSNDPATSSPLKSLAFAVK